VRGILAHPSYMRKVCVVTTNRSDWSKLEPVALSLLQSNIVQVDVIALGSHMLYELGDTRKAVKENFPNAYEIHTLVAGNSTESMADSVGFGIVKLTSLFKLISPDVVLIHGDRFDAFSAAVAANMLNLFIAHVEGGELSGTVDGTLRHAMTKLAHLHFACTYEASRRIRAMGEPPGRVILTGCPSYDKLFALSANSWMKNDMDPFFEGSLFKIQPKCFSLVLMHPVTNDSEENVEVFETLMTSLFLRRNPTVMFYPNIDPGNKTMLQVLHRYQRNHPDWATWLRFLSHVPPERFMTMMMHASAMIGNSSAGIRETCVFGTPTLNLGSRQDGRKTPQNVTTIVNPSPQSIAEWLDQESNKIYPASYMYGRHDSARLIAQQLEALQIDRGHLKDFWEQQYSLLPPPHLQNDEQTTEKAASNAPDPKVLGLITARGGSKGIPGKNIVDLCGKPLIQHTIQSALGANLLDRVVLSTDSEEIAAVALNCGCEVPFMRPPELSQDDSSHLQCILHALDRLRNDDGYSPDYVLLLQPTSPFRTSEDIDAAIDIIKQTNCDLVVSVTESPLNLSKHVYVGEDSRLLPYAEVTDTLGYIRRQQLPKTFSENGAIFLQRAESLRSPPCHTPNFGSLRSDDARVYVMPRERSLDIDSPYDLHLARLLMTSPFTTEPGTYLDVHCST
tara:strand:- start:604 stop:2631 length:2028 start_codon:yes stop_codon:yes gene_type:complete